MKVSAFLPFTNCLSANTCNDSGKANFCNGNEIFCSPSVPDTLQLLVLIVLLTSKHSLTHEHILTNNRTCLSFLTSYITCLGSLANALAGMGQIEATSAERVYSREKISFGGIDLTQKVHKIFCLDPNGKYLAKMATTPVLGFNCQSGFGTEM